MAARFDYFVIFAEMRTGSNFLEANLNAFESFQSYGEAFNPHFIGYPNKTEILGLDQAQRDRDPMSLISAIKAAPDHLGGFRFFNDHDGRVLEPMLSDPRCAKIILTRNPLDSYVSWKIAQATGQWKLTDVRRRRDQKVAFDPIEFTMHVTRLQDFQVKLLNALQKSGQTAFYIAYEDLQDLEVINGLARFLGSDEKLAAHDGQLKRQNPSPISEKVENFEEVTNALAALDQFNLSRTPNFEPRRGAAVPTYIATRDAGLIFMPVQGGPTQAISDWLGVLEPSPLIQGMNQRALRDWKASHQPHRSFTVVRHPVARAFETFVTKILDTGPGSFLKIRRTLRNRFELPIPENMPDSGFDLEAQRTAFTAYLKFMQVNLNGQTAIRQDGHWVTQTSTLAGFSQVMTPDVVLREDELERTLPELGVQMGAPKKAYVHRADDLPFQLADIYDADIEALTRAAYARDYEAFGFGNWR